MWQITSALIEDRMGTLRAEADHQRLVAVARRARKTLRRQPTQTLAMSPIETVPVGSPHQEPTERDRELVGRGTG